MGMQSLRGDYGSRRALLSLKRFPVMSLGD